MSIKIAVIDGMGGGIGTEIVSQIRKELPADVTIIALGTNATATNKMVQAKANSGATGKNAIRVSINSVDYIIGPIGIIMPNSLMGEVTPKIAKIIINAPGKKLLLPINQPHVTFVGIEEKPIKELIISAFEIIKKEKKLLT